MISRHLFFVIPRYVLVDSHEQIITFLKIEDQTQPTQVKREELIKYFLSNEPSLHCILSLKNPLNLKRCHPCVTFVIFLHSLFNDNIKYFRFESHIWGFCLRQTLPFFYLTHEKDQNKIGSHYR